MKKQAYLTLLILFIVGCTNTAKIQSHLACNNCITERNDFWNSWLKACAPGNTASSTSANWDSTTFTTLGVTYADFKTNDSADYMAMSSLYATPQLAEKYLPGVIESGSNYPDQRVIHKGEYLTKIVKLGANISGFSVYYLHPDELKELLTSPSRLEQNLGLPLTSNAGNYLVYRIYALTDNVVFESHVAPTMQYHSVLESVYFTCGGAIQTLIINNSDTTKWAKDSIPSDTLNIHKLPDIDQLLKLKN